MATIKSNGGVYAPTAKTSTYFYSKLMKEIRDLEHRLDKTEKTLKKVREENKCLKAENKQLKEENQRLRSIIANNSTNSSLPPSTDQKPSKDKAPNRYNSRVKTKLKPGGQPGHLGTTLTRKAVKKLIHHKKVQHKVIYTGDFSNMDKSSKHSYKSYYVIDLEIKPTVTEYRLPSSTILPDAISKRLRTGVCYGDTLRTIAIQLNTANSVSISRVRDFLNNLTNSSVHDTGSDEGNGSNGSKGSKDGNNDNSDILSISTGAVYGFIDNFANAHNTSSSIASIMDNLKNEKILYTDATNISVNGKQAFIRNQSNPNTVLYCPMARKTKEMIGESGILKDYKGILVHDHETTLFNFGTDHAECNAHIIRYLKKTIEDTNHTWAKDMLDLLTELNNYKSSLIEQGIAEIGSKELQDYYDRYIEIINQGNEQNKKSKKSKYFLNKEKGLLARMEKYQYNHLLFLRDFDVPFTNNMSERDLRKCKTKQKVSGGFRKPSGQKIYCDIMSIIETMKRRDINVFNGLKRMLAGETVL